MPHDLQSWNIRHREAASHAPPPPAAFLVECFPLLPRPSSRSLALDLACGAGQNAVYLAERGWPVVAVDFSSAALDRAAALAASRGIAVQRVAPGATPAQFHGIVLVEADLTSRLECDGQPAQAGLTPLFFNQAFPPGRARPSARSSPHSHSPAFGFDLILCFHYLHRPLLPAIERALAPGGYLLYETFSEPQTLHAEGPHSPEHLLHSGELPRAFSHLVPIFYRECQSPRAVASLFACRPPHPS